MGYSTLGAARFRRVHMFLAGLLGLAAVGGAAYAVSDMFVGDEDDADDSVNDDSPTEIPKGNLLEVGENVEDPETEDPSTGTVVSEFEGDLVIAGADGMDALTGQDGDDQINGYGGDDLISGGCGDDVLHGGEGADLVSGGHGNDVLHGEAGDDQLAGDDGDDDLYGHFGEDELDGGDGADALYGGQGSDSLVGGAGDDALHGGFGDDILAGGAGADVVFGGDGNDVLYGDDADGAPQVDFLNGGAGDDTILAQSGDVATGGAGNDNIILDTDEDDEEVTVMGFQPGQDKLLITWEDPIDPDIEIETDSENANLTRVMINGQEVAHLYGAEGITSTDIQLISEAELTQYGQTG
ncbi:calcium-binding protein [Ruegeria sp. EL01]|uniref:calcium-binding protein n=1 Tax=Ruegeria sp. EL01 TaxID=2107578 RepID=UPI0020B10856|nr:calcium-binding protein [Ruegeria sp. EL01]